MANTAPDEPVQASAGARERLGLPTAEVHGDLTHHDGVVDQRNYAHRPFALGTFERVGFVYLADEPR
jgi:hypothetical protein